MKKKSTKKPDEVPLWSERPLILRLYPDSVLREMCRPVENFDSSLQDFSHEMHRSMQHWQGIGLAAPQVGIRRRFILADIGEGPVFVANPEIVARAGRGVLDEGCLSLPEIQVEVERALAVEISGWDAHGKSLKLQAHGLLARVLLHEIDHLDGVLIIDHGEPLTGAENKEAVRQGLGASGGMQ